MTSITDIISTEISNGQWRYLSSSNLSGYPELCYITTCLATVMLLQYAMYQLDDVLSSSPLIRLHITSHKLRITERRITPGWVAGKSAVNILLHDPTPDQPPPRQFTFQWRLHRRLDQARQQLQWFRILSQSCKQHELMGRFSKKFHSKKPCEKAARASACFPKHCRATPSR